MRAEFHKLGDAKPKLTLLKQKHRDTEVLRAFVMGFAVGALFCLIARISGIW